MKIKVMSRNMAILYSENLKIPTIIISITSKDEENVIFAENENIIDICRLSFNDLDRDIEKYKAPILSDFDGLKEFIDKYPNIDILVHCGAGVSRSPAVAMAIGDYLKIDTGINMSKNYDPNRLVYRLALYSLTGYRFGDGFLPNPLNKA